MGAESVTERQRVQLSVTGSKAPWSAAFTAMASPCVVLADCDSKELATQIGEVAAREVARIEQCFSRYRDDNVVYRINNAAGRSVPIDGETQRLLAYAAECYELSGGLFDITSGVLRKVWNFDGGERVPNRDELSRVMANVGWSKVKLGRDTVQMPAGMELDFGGFGKEYAADRALQLIREMSDCPVLVNLGGDLVASGARRGGAAWQIGVERPGNEEQASLIIELRGGALATSGDSRRYVLHAGQRLSHVLDPTSGWPVESAPQSVTVAAPRCTEAGLLATLALLQGGNAESFLRDQAVPHWVLRSAS